MQAKKKQICVCLGCFYFLLANTSKSHSYFLVTPKTGVFFCVVTCFVLSFELLQTAEESQSVKARPAKIQVQYPHHVLYSCD